MIENILHFEKGTTSTIAVQIVQDDGTVYSPEQGDSCKLKISRNVNQNVPDVSITGSYDSENDCFTFQFEPEDTSTLMALLPYTRYWYDVTLQTNEGDFYRVITASPFLLHPGIGRKETS